MSGRFVSPAVARRSRHPFACRLALCALVASLLGSAFAVYSHDSGLRLQARVLESAERKYGASSRKRLEAWQALIESARGRSEPDKLALVNDFFNRIPFVSDTAHWGAEDYWATPVEMLASNGGDCEDFSIGKYFTLLALGITMDKLKITYVKTRDPNPINQSHMVLTYYSTQAAMPLVLDNLVPDIKSADERSDLTPVYAFNGAGLWLAKERGTGKAVAGGSGNIAFWRELTARMGSEFK